MDSCNIKESSFISNSNYNLFFINCITYVYNLLKFVYK